MFSIDAPSQSKDPIPRTKDENDQKDELLKNGRLKGIVPRLQVATECEGGAF